MRDAPAEPDAPAAERDAPVERAAPAERAAPDPRERAPAPPAAEPGAEGDNLMPPRAP
jgi:hypothetical protein